MMTLCCAAPIAACRQAEEKITVYERFVEGDCIGKCGDTVLEVSSRGIATYHVRWALERTWSRYVYPISRQEFLSFRQIMRPLRPAGVERPAAPCHDSHGRKNPAAYGVLWQGGGPVGRLYACRSSDRFGMAFLEGYKALRISIEGGKDRLTPEEASHYR